MSNGQNLPGKSKRTMYDPPEDPKPTFTEMQDGKPVRPDSVSRSTTQEFEAGEMRERTPEQEGGQYVSPDAAKLRAADDGVLYPDDGDTLARTSSRINVPILRRQAPEGGYNAQNPEESAKIELLRNIVLAAAKKYPNESIRVQPRDNSSQHLYTLSVRPKHLKPTHSGDMKANDYVGIKGGTLEEILAFVTD